MIKIATAFAILIFTLSTASAHSYHRYYKHHHYTHHRVYRVHSMPEGLGIGLKHMMNSARPSDCYGIPWCGCYMRHRLGVVDRAYNLARNWAHWGRATGAQIGAVVVWAHHVGQIVGQASNGEWIILSGNDGHAVRERPRSLAGVIAIRTGGYGDDYREARTKSAKTKISQGHLSTVSPFWQASAW